MSRTRVVRDVFQHSGVMCDKQPPGTYNAYYNTTAGSPVTLYIVLAGLHLPSFIPLVSTMPADKHLFASHTPHKPNCSNKARHRIIFSKRQ